MRYARSIVVSVALVAGGLVALATPAAATEGPHLSTLSTFSGNGGYSTDGLGQIGTGGSIQADVPAGSTVENAYLYGTYFGYVVVESAPSESERTITVDSTDVVLDLIALDPDTGLATARADVTDLVSDKVGSGAATPTDFQINSDPFDDGFARGLDGVGLVVIYSNPGLPSTTISVVDGAAAPEGDSETVTFPAFAASSSARMSLGIGFSSQDGLSSGVPGTHDCPSSSPPNNAFAQYSEIDINVDGDRLTSCAGNYDDGTAGNGGLITVGGVGDSVDNPADPFQEPQDGAEVRVTDDELYDLSSFIDPGDTSVTIKSKNPSANDNLFLAVVQTAVAQRTLTITNPGSGVGTVTATDGGTQSCTLESGASCSLNYDDETAVTLSASAASGSTFSGWSGGDNCSGTGTCTVTMNADKTVFASFNQNTNSNSASGFVPPGGTIQTCSNTSATDDTCSAIKLPNTGNGAFITITEQPGSAFNFCGGKCSNQTTTYSFTPTDSYTNINNPPKVILRYRTPGTSTKADMYFLKFSKAIKIADCRKIGIANPNPCVSARNRLGFGTNDLQVQVLVTSDDPTIGKR